MSDSIEKFWADWLTMWSAYPYTEQRGRLDALIASCQEQLLQRELEGWSEVWECDGDEEVR